MIAWVVLACGRTPTDTGTGPTVGGWIYAYGFCSFKCYRLDVCGVATETTEACETACIDEALETLESDPCWAQQVELRRCFVLEAPCDGVADEQLSAGAELECAEPERRLLECDS